MINQLKYTEKSAFYVRKLGRAGCQLWKVLQEGIP